MTKRKQGFAPLPRRAILAAAAGAAVSAGTPGARAGTAEDWPTRPVRYINLFPPGGATDVMSRIYCARMGALAGQQFVVENRAGAGGTVGQAAIAQAAPDGYTIGLGSIASLAIAPSIYPSLPYDPGRDFTFVAGVWKVPNLLVVNLDFPPRSLPELIRLVRENPGRFSYGSGGSGTSPHLTMELLKHHAGLEMLHVPYRGGAPAMIDLLAGRIQLMFDNIPTVVGALREGRMRALGVTGAERNPAIPEVPAIREFLPDFEEITSWGGVVGPPGLAPGVVRRLNALTKQALADEELQAIFRQNGATAWWTTPAEFAAFREQQQAFFARLVRISGAALN
jgi:tripartite-type tricarboxylate transporter receptor subunit TctC